MGKGSTDRLRLPSRVLVIGGRYQPQLQQMLAEDPQCGYLKTRSRGGVSRILIELTGQDAVSPLLGSPGCVDRKRARPREPKRETQALAFRRGETSKKAQPEIDAQCSPIRSPRPGTSASCSAPP